MLDAHVRMVRQDFELNVTVGALVGTTVAVVGPNGAGKTTLLRGLAGLTRLDHGHTSVGTTDWERTVSKTWVPPEHRSCSLVLADPLLFPHMTVLKNVAFGQRARGVAHEVAREASFRWLSRLGIEQLASRRPGTLSTGQQQRAALARALAVEPQLLLLDEPLSAQDPLVRTELRGQLASVLANYPGVTLFVTHDPVDALTLADHLLVIEHGLLVQSGSPAELAARPATEFVASMVGLNLLRGTGTGTDTRVDGGGRLQAVDNPVGRVFICFAPHAVALSSPRQGSAGAITPSSPRNVWSATVRELQSIHGRVRVQLQGPPDVVAEITPAAALELQLAPGRPVVASVKATEIEVYPG